MSNNIVVDDSIPERVSFARGPHATIPQTMVPGRVLVEVDTGDMFVDDDETTRFQVKDSTKLPLAGGTITGNLTVNGVTNLVGSVTLDNELTVEGKTKIRDGLIVSQQLSVAGYAIFSDELIVDGNAVFSRNVSIDGSATIRQDTTITSLLTVDDLQVNGHLQSDDGVDIVGDMTVRDITAAGKVTVNKDLSVDNNLTVSGDGTIDGSLTVTGGIEGNASSATKLETARTIDGVDFDGTTNIAHYAVCSSAADAADKVVSLTGFKLVPGAEVTVQFTSDNTASDPTLDVSNTGAKAIYYKGTPIPSYYLEGNGYYKFVYDGTYYELIGSASATNIKDLKIGPETLEVNMDSNSPTTEHSSVRKVTITRPDGSTEDYNFNNTYLEYKDFKAPSATVGGYHGLVPQPPSGGNIPVTPYFLTSTGWQQSGFKGASATTDGGVGLVPKPVAGDQIKFLKGDGTWQEVVTGGGSADDFLLLSGGTMTGSIVPNTTNTLNLGSASQKWANVYATTFHGALDGNAATATKLTTDIDKVRVTDGINNTLCLLQVSSSGNPTSLYRNSYFTAYSNAARCSITIGDAQHTGIIGLGAEDGKVHNYQGHSSTFDSTKYLVGTSQDSGVGSNTQPVYVTGNGVIEAADPYPTSLPANGGNADTVDNVHISVVDDGKAGTDWFATYTSYSQIRAVSPSRAKVGYAANLDGFVAGSRTAGTHDANATTVDGMYYYSSNGPSTSLGASTNDGALYCQAHNTTWQSQIAQDYRNGRLFVRGKNNGTWTDWKRIAQFDERYTTVVGGEDPSHTYSKVATVTVASVNTEVHVLFSVTMLKGVSSMSYGKSLGLLNFSIITGATIAVDNAQGNLYWEIMSSQLNYDNYQMILSSGTDSKGRSALIADLWVYKDLADGAFQFTVIDSGSIRGTPGSDIWTLQLHSSISVTRLPSYSHDDIQSTVMTIENPNTLYMYKNNPSGTGKLSLDNGKLEVGHSTNSATGIYSVSVGQTAASQGQASFAEGMYNTARGLGGHITGVYGLTMTPRNRLSLATGDAFVVGNGVENDTTGAATRSNAFKVSYAGSTYSLNSLKTTGADYAEFFEWLDGNPNDEDRVGYFVTLTERKTSIASPGDYILGVVSGAPCILGNADDDWIGKWEHDEFDRFAKLYFKEEKGEQTQLPEDLAEEDIEWYCTENNIMIEQGEDGQVRYYETYLVEVDYKTPLWRYKVNPNYDPNQTYVERQDRKEWDAVGMLGVLAVRDDGTCQVNSYCKVAEGGIATAADSESFLVEGQAVQGYRVVGRTADNVVRIIFR